MKEAAAAAASGATQDEATSTTPPTSASTSVTPMQVEHPKDEVIPVTGTADADQPDVEISEAALKRSEDEDVPESRKVRKINGLAVCSMDIVGAAQADCDAPQLLENGSEQKAGGDTDAVHTHEGEPMKSFKVPIPEQDIIGVKSGPVLDPAKVQAARQKEIDSIARHEVVELVATSECKQGAHVKGGWVEDTKGDVVRSRFVAKQVACNPRDDVSQSTPALLILRLLLSIAVSVAPFFCGSVVVLSIWDISVAFFHAIMDELVYVHAPRDLVPPGWGWKLRRSMYGTRRASRLWADYVRCWSTMALRQLRCSPWSSSQQEVHRGSVGRRLCVHRGV